MRQSPQLIVTGHFGEVPCHRCCMEVVRYLACWIGTLRGGGYLIVPLLFILPGAFDRATHSIKHQTKTVRKTDDDSQHT